MSAIIETMSKTAYLLSSTSQFPPIEPWMAYAAIVVIGGLAAWLATRKRSTEPNDRKGRSFRLGLRTVIGLVTIVCVGLEWVVVQFNWIHERHGVLQYSEAAPADSLQPRPA